MPQKIALKKGGKITFGQTLGQSDNWFSQIFQVAPIPMAITRFSDGAYLAVNDAFTKWIEYSRKELLGQTSRHFNIRVVPKERSIIKNVLKRHKMYTESGLEMRAKSGKIYSATSFLESVRFNGEQAILGLYYDYTETKHKEEEIAEDRAKDEAILSSIGEGIVAVDTNGKIILINPQASFMLGVKEKDVLGKSLFEIQPLFDEHGSLLPKEKRLVYTALKSKKRITAAGLNISYVKDGSRKFPASITATPIVSGGKVIGAVQVFRDITKEKEMDKAKSELISLASHQLRTPLSAINWYAEALIKEELGKLNPNQKKYLQEIFNANQRMIELVYDFLNVSRIELGTFSLKLSKINVGELAHELLGELKQEIVKKRLKIKEVYSKNLAGLNLDRKIVRIILQNLITNAVKYTPRGGSTTVEISLKGGASERPQLFIKVSDTGVGIPKKQQAQIFTKLFRADNIKKMDASGTGLGLYIVKSFAEFCGGKVWFKSRENKGTVFYVDLPLAEK